MPWTTPPWICPVASKGLVVPPSSTATWSRISTIPVYPGRPLGDNECNAFADESNLGHRYYRPVRHHGTRNYPVRFDVADLAGENRRLRGQGARRPRPPPLQGLHLMRACACGERRIAG